MHDTTPNPPGPSAPPVSAGRGNPREVAAAFGKLGLISFGGPVAHLGYFRAEFVQKRRWLDDAAYADLVALCQFLPGPASSQAVFALGMRRAGLIGAIVASACFTLPSAILLIAFAYGVAHASDLGNAGWLHGLKLAAVAVVAQAVWGMGKALCPDRPRLLLAMAAAALLLLVGGALAQVGVIAGGAVAGFGMYRRHLAAPDVAPAARTRRGRVAAVAALILFFALLITLPLLAKAVPGRAIETFDSFYRAGSLVFGGGHVVLPLLREEVVPRGWVSDDAFLAGYGAAQAIPGPLFTFSAYLGAAMRPGPSPWPWPWANGLWCLLAVFLPAWLLIAGALPFWERVRRRSWAQAALRGANAAVVGVLGAALYDPVITEGVRDARDVAAALIAFAALQLCRAPPWAVVIAMAGVGALMR